MDRVITESPPTPRACSRRSLLDEPTQMVSPNDSTLIAVFLLDDHDIV